MAEPDSFDADELTAWSSVATLLEWLPAALDAQLQRDSGMSHFEFGILFALTRSEAGVLRMSTLAALANSTLPRLSRAAARLESRGWVRREPDPDDGRFTLAVLTPAGRRAAERAAPGHVALVRQVVFGALTPRQARDFGASCRAVAAAIRPDGAWVPSGE